MRVRLSSKKYWVSKKKKGKRFPRTWKLKEQMENESSSGPAGVQYFHGGPVIYLLKNMDGEDPLALEDTPPPLSSSDYLEEFHQFMLEEDRVESCHDNDHPDPLFGKELEAYIDKYLRNEEFDVEEILPTDDWAQYLENWGSDLDNSEIVEENAVSSLLTPTEEDDSEIGGHHENDYNPAVISTTPIVHEYF